VEIKIFAKTDLALKGLTEHYKDTLKFKNRVGLRAYGITHDLDKKVLIINLKGLVKMIMKKGGNVLSLTDKIKADFLKDLSESMLKVGATREQYEVVFND